MDLLLQRIFDGMYNGAIYASLALALVAIYRSTNLLNLAQGEMAMLSGYVSLVLMSSPATTTLGVTVAGTTVASVLPWHPWPAWAAVLGAIAFGTLLGVVIEYFCIRRLRGRDDLTRMNVSIGLLIVLNGLTVGIWGTGSRALGSPFPVGFGDHFDIGGARLRYSTLGVWAVLMIVVGLLTLLLVKTKAGLAFRAITSNPDSARLVGVSVTRMTAFGWGVASGIGAMAAALIGGALVLEPFLMMKLLIFGFAAATIGGLDSPGGAIVGGIIVGISQSLIPGYLGVPTELALIPPLAMMVIVLLVRPQGLFGLRRVVRV